MVIGSRGGKWYRGILRGESDEEWIEGSTVCSRAPTKLHVPDIQEMAQEILELECELR